MMTAAWWRDGFCNGHAKMICQHFAFLIIFLLLVTTTNLAIGVGAVGIFRGLIRVEHVALAVCTEHGGLGFTVLWSRVLNGC